MRLVSVEKAGQYLYFVAEGIDQRFELLVNLIEGKQKSRLALSLKRYHSRPHWSLEELDRLGLPRFWNKDWLETTSKGLGGLEYVAQLYDLKLYDLEQFVNAMYLEDPPEIQSLDIRSLPVDQQRQWAINRYNELREKRVSRPTWHIQRETGIHPRDLARWFEEARRFKQIK